MTRSQALAAVRTFNASAVLTLADDECCDDQISLFGNEDIGVQISASRDGLVFSAAVASGEGDEWGVRFGKQTRDPVEAARQAIEYATLDGIEMPAA